MHARIIRAARMLLSPSLPGGANDDGVVGSKAISEF